ncbi:MAG: hypothetical protein ACRDTX_13115 [Pseudonocardiaceae bacterium]
MVETGGEAGSASFDAAQYHHAIIRPLRGKSRRLPRDLRVRYDVHDPQSDQALAGHLDKVIGYWSERSHEQADYSHAVYVALLKAHQDLLTDPAVRLYSTAWWSTYQPSEPDLAAKPAKPPLSDAGAYTQHLTQPLEKPSSNVAAEGDAVIEPLDAAVATSTTGMAGDAPTVDGSMAAAPAADGQLTEEASINRVCGLTASRIGDTIELSWLWPNWATTAIVSWESDRISKSVDREEFRRTGRWQTTVSPELSDDRVEFSVAVRGASPNHREWSEAVRVLAPAPRQEVTYKVRRLWYRFPSRAYKVSFCVSRRPALCEIMIGFSGADALPENVDVCTKIDTAYLAADMSTRLVTLPRSLGRGWLRCFLVNGESITLKDPDVSTLRIRSWLR